MKKKASSRQISEFMWGWIFILPTMIGLIVLNIYPMLDTIKQSFYNDIKITRNTICNPDPIDYYENAIRGRTKKQ